MKARRPVLLLVVMPGNATAHGSLPGGGGFYSGIIHPVLAVEQFAALLAFGLLLGRQTGDHARSPAELAIGVMEVDAMPMLPALALVCGVVLACALPALIWGTVILAGLIGWLVGRGTRVPHPTSSSQIAACLPHAGVFVGVFLIVLNAAALAMVAQGPIGKVAVRVLGSWIAAIALLVLTLRLNGPGTS